MEVLPVVLVSSAEFLVRHRRREMRNDSINLAKKGKEIVDMTVRGIAQLQIALLRLEEVFVLPYQKETSNDRLPSLMLEYLVLLA